MNPDSKQNTPSTGEVKLFDLIKPYAGILIVLLISSALSNGLNLLIPNLIGQTIDSFNQDPNYSINQNLLQLSLICLAVFVLTLVSIYTTNLSAEKLAKDLRTRLTKKISNQSYGYISKVSPSDLLTNFTSDVDSVKQIISQGFVNALSAIIILVGSVILILSINWRLGLIAISILPIIAITFTIVFRRIMKYFKQAQENLSRINKVVNESVAGAMLIRVLNSQSSENQKFAVVNEKAKQIGYSIINGFSALIPIVNLVSNLAIVIILWFGGRQVVSGELSLGEFSAFISYYNLLITPIFIFGFISSLISRSFVSLGRINDVLKAPDNEQSVESAGLVKSLDGKIEFDQVSLRYGKKDVLKHVSFLIQPGTRTAILGPTAAGKTQLFSLLTGLVTPTQGVIKIDGEKLESFDRDSLFSQVGLVFQDSIIFNTTLKENIEFKSGMDPEQIEKAIETASLQDLIVSLPEGLNTMVSERGSNLSGGQKQRLMLARALALNPKILLLDDFTARVDIQTERDILHKLSKNYPDITLVSITQKIEPIMDYDQILLMMEGELIGAGTHQSLMEKSIEYRQIWESQQSTEN